MKKGVLIFVAVLATTLFASTANAAMFSKHAVQSMTIVLKKVVKKQVRIQRDGTTIVTTRQDDGTAVRTVIYPDGTVVTTIIPA
ncbi:MAG: hypothetical protein ACTTKF_00390 [Bacteroides sp.]